MMCTLPTPTRRANWATDVPGCEAVQSADVAWSLQGIGISTLAGLNPVGNTLLWLVGLCVAFGIGCIVANAVLWWRADVRRGRGATWWTRV
jgi:hypothetical protein